MYALLPTREKKKRGLVEDITYSAGGRRVLRETVRWRHSRNTMHVSSDKHGHGRATGNGNGTLFGTAKGMCVRGVSRVVLSTLCNLSQGPRTT